MSEYKYSIHNCEYKFDVPKPDQIYLHIYRTRNGTSADLSLSSGSLAQIQRLQQMFQTLFTNWDQEISRYPEIFNASASPVKFYFWGLFKRWWLPWVTLLQPGSGLGLTRSWIFSQSTGIHSIFTPFSSRYTQRMLLFWFHYILYLFTGGCHSALEAW